jgi:diguanylate cyclase (GGDEF)-like protein
VTLDVRTVVVMLILSSVLMAVTLAVGNRSGRGNGLGKWNLGLGLYAFGWLLVAARGTLPDIASMAAADGLLLAGLCLQLTAVIEFGGAAAPRALIYVPGPLLFAALLPMLADYALFTLTASLAYAVVLAAIALHAWRLGPAAGAARWMLTLPYGVGAAVLMARAVVIMLDATAYPSLFAGSAVHAAAFLTLFAMTCSASTAFLLMLRERSEASIRHLAMYDPLTGLLNRRAFTELAERELARARRTGLPFAVLMMDLDYFKRVNDEFGHQAGDRVLAAFAATAKHNVRTEDLVGRYGGEEFCAVLPGTDLPKTLEIAERIRAAVAKQPLAGLPRSTTVSIGAAACRPAASCTLDEATACADAAMYRAKNEGRDRVVVAELVRTGEPQPALPSASELSQAGISAFLPAHSAPADTAVPATEPH